MSNINGQFQKGRTKTGGRAKGTPNKKTTELIELLGDYNPIIRLIEIAKDENTSLDMQVKINLDLLPYIYPKRKSIDMNSNEMPEVKIYINHEEVGVESKEHF